MKCVICKKGNTYKGKTTVTLKRGEVTLVFKNVPAEVCENCGGAYVNGSTSQELLKQAEEAVLNGVVVDIREYIAA